MGGPFDTSAGAWALMAAAVLVGLVTVLRARGIAVGPDGAGRPPRGSRRPVLVRHGRWAGGLVGRHCVVVHYVDAVRCARGHPAERVVVGTAVPGTRPVALVVCPLCDRGRCARCGRRDGEARSPCPGCQSAVP